MGKSKKRLRKAILRIFPKAAQRCVPKVVCKTWQRCQSTNLPTASLRTTASQMWDGGQKTTNLNPPPTPVKLNYIGINLAIIGQVVKAIRVDVDKKFLITP